MGACTTCHLVLRWWSGCRDLNPGPLRPERSALPSCATARSELPRSPIILAGGSRIEQRSHDRGHLRRGRFVILNYDLTNPTTFHRLHSKCPILVCVSRAGLRYFPGQIENESGDGDVLAFGNRNAERLFHFIDVGLPVDEPAVLADAHDRRFLVFVELVVQVAHQLFEDVAAWHHAPD